MLVKKYIQRIYNYCTKTSIEEVEKVVLSALVKKEEVEDTNSIITSQEEMLTTIKEQDSQSVVKQGTYSLQENNPIIIKELEGLLSLISTKSNIILVQELEKKTM